MNQTTTTASSTISAEAISNRAYELWENEGRPEGSDQRHWLQAEQELRGATNTSTPSRNSDVTPLKGTRAAAAVESSAARPTPAPAASKSTGKRASASPFPSSGQGKKVPAL